MLSLTELAGRLCLPHGALITVSANGRAAVCAAPVEHCTTAVLRAWAMTQNGHVPADDNDQTKNGTVAEGWDRHQSQSDPSAPAAPLPGVVGARSEKAPQNPQSAASSQSLNPESSNGKTAPFEGANAGSSPASGVSRNGHAAPILRRPTLKQWQDQLVAVAYRCLTQDPEYRDKEVPAEACLTPLIEDMKVGVEALIPLGYPPPEDLSAADIIDEIDLAARSAIEAWANRLIWAVPEKANAAVGAKSDTALKPFQSLSIEEADKRWSDRQAVEAFSACEAMLADKREYAWDGLIRDGCTAVLSGLMSSGKSTLAMNLVRGWAIGGEVLERQCRQSKTLVVVSPKEFEAWSDTIHFWDLHNLVYLIESTKAHFGNVMETVAWFDYTMRKWDCRTFVLDTLFDFFGMPPNTSGDSNRIAMAEQTPLLQLVREQGYAGLMTGHAPKSEAKAIDPRDPEEAFGGHTAWTAQHRMRMTVRRKSQGVNVIITGLGGYGDRGIRKETSLVFEEQSRIVTLGGLYAEEIGKAALPSVLQALTEFGEPISISKLEKITGKGEAWLRAGLNEGRKSDADHGPQIIREGKGRATKYRLANSAFEREQVLFEHKDS